VKRRRWFDDDRVADESPSKREAASVDLGVEHGIAAARRRALRPITNADDLVARALANFRSMGTVLRDSRVPLKRRREVLRRLLPTRDGVRPIPGPHRPEHGTRLAQGAEARRGAPPCDRRRTSRRAERRFKFGFASIPGSSRKSRTTGRPGVGPRRRAAELGEGAGSVRTGGGWVLVGAGANGYV
jgi:hypothetical protein